MTYRIFITGSGIAQEAQELLKMNGCVFRVGDPNDSSTEIANKLKAFKPDGIIVRQGKITRQVQDAAENLKVISKHGTGIDNIDIAAANERGIAVMSTPLANYESVAEHAISLILCLARSITVEDKLIRKGGFDKKGYIGMELSGKILGLVGFGHIGRRVAELVAPFKMKVSVYHPSCSEEILPQHVSKAQYVDEIFPVADFISMHCPLTKETEGMINKHTIEQMKPSVYFVNTARGGIVKEADLIDALQNKRILGAALDVFETEPLAEDNPLRAMDNVILTPHVAGISDRSFVNMGVTAVQNALTVLRKEPPDLNCLRNKEIVDNG
jgi:D-3-phosphoglycerate dehydrogenase